MQNYPCLLDQRACEAEDSSIGKQCVIGALLGSDHGQTTFWLFYEDYYVAHISTPSIDGEVCCGVVGRLARDVLQECWVAIAGKHRPIGDTQVTVNPFAVLLQNLGARQLQAA